MICQSIFLIVYFLVSLSSGNNKTLPEKDNSLVFYPKILKTNEQAIVLIPGLIDLQKGYLEYKGRFYPLEVMTKEAKIEMILVKPGEFTMGSMLTPEEIKNMFNITNAEFKIIRQYINGERPQHKVIIQQPFYLGKYEVTQTQYETIMEENPSFFAFLNEPNLPIENVSWEDAKKFCENLGSNFRLPTEAEWEFACRSGSQTLFYWGDSCDGNFCWYDTNSNIDDKIEPHIVGQRKPNSWGFYDMIGNVWEWCNDWYDKDYYSTRPNIESDPLGPESDCLKKSLNALIPIKQINNEKVVRGGSFINECWYIRSAVRTGMEPKEKEFYVGFRIARSID